MQRLRALLSRAWRRDASGTRSAPGAAEVPEPRQKGQGRLHSAAASGDLAQLQRRWWWERLRINQGNAEKQTLLHLACANGHADIVRFLAGQKCQLNLRDSFKKSPLMKAVEHQHKECAAILLEHGAKPDLRGAGDNTALHLAAIMSSKCLVELLLEHNAHIDAQNEFGCTPLAVAIAEHHEEMVEFLLQKGADVHAQDNHLRTTLMVAVMAGNVNIIRCLLRHGADPSHKDSVGFTALDTARQMGNADIAKLLEEHEGCEKTGGSSAEGREGQAVLDTSGSVVPAAVPMSTPHQTGAGALAAEVDCLVEELGFSDNEMDNEDPPNVSNGALLPVAKTDGDHMGLHSDLCGNGALAAEVDRLVEELGFSDNEMDNQDPQKVSDGVLLPAAMTGGERTGLCSDLCSNGALAAEVDCLVEELGFSDNEVKS